MTLVRTRFAPSPTGFLHVGGARTALFSYLEARRNGGQFILRVEDTDRERSTDAAVQAIIDGMQWLGLDHDEGPFYQTQRFERYRQVAQELLAAGKAYHCWCSKEDLEAMRADQEARGLKPRYNGLWRESTADVAVADDAESLSAQSREITTSAWGPCAGSRFIGERNDAPGG